MSSGMKKRLLFGLAVLFFAFTLLQASWLAPKPEGSPQVLASGPVDIPKDASGCAKSPALGLGAEETAPDVRMLQGAVGGGANAIIITPEMTPDGPALKRFFKTDCAYDNAQPPAKLSQAAANLTAAELFIMVPAAADVPAIMAAAPAASRPTFIGDEKVVAAVRKINPKAAAFSIDGARACTSAYKATGWTSFVPAACQNGTALVTLDEVGYTLWGWPNRFLARMKAAGTRVIIAKSVDGTKVTGLSDPKEYGEIANSYDGVIWVDNIEEMGRALVR
jgi:glycerophosphoryl diester phosphodiesterase